MVEQKEENEIEEEKRRKRRTNIAASYLSEDDMGEDFIALITASWIVIDIYK